jgi:spectinomycin phosphotransferase
MIKKPFLSDKDIIPALKTHYGLQLPRLEFLPLGYDPYSALYQVVTADRHHYLLKSYREQFQHASILVPRYLKVAGISQVLAPLTTKENADFCTVEDITLVLFPYLVGTNAREMSLSPEQWHRLGAALRQIHDTELPDDIASQVNRHDYYQPPPVYTDVRTYHQTIEQAAPRNLQHEKLQSVWKSHREVIKQLLLDFKQASQQLHQQSPKLVLCHGDIHTGNVLVDEAGQLHIIDWDSPRYAPAESDLIFFRENGTSDFWDGYGTVTPDERIYRYYGYRWLLQEIQEYSDMIVNADNRNQESIREVALQELIAVLPG